MACAYIELGEYDDAKSNLDNAYKNIREYYGECCTEIMDIYKAYEKLYIRLDETDKAMEYHEKYLQINEALSKEN